MKYIFVRHGEPDDFDENGQRLGNSASLLTKRGQDEARRAGDTIKSIYDPKFLVSSTSPRAYQTAELINERIGKAFIIQEIGIDEEMAVDTLPILPGMSQETVNKVITTLPRAYAEAKRTIKELQSRKFNADIIHVTHSHRMTMIHWTLLNDKEPTREEYLKFWKSYGSGLEMHQRQHADTRFCKMFAVDFSKEKGQQIEYPYLIESKLQG